MLIGLLAIQSAFVGNGLLGISVLALKKLCTCDHESIVGVETKVSPEDGRFRSGNYSLQIVDSPLQTRAQSSESSVPSCHKTGDPSEHGANPEEAHFCPHEKTLHTLENSAFALSVLEIGPDFSYSSPDLVTLYILIDREALLPVGYTHNLERPPQV